jgi:hypothetical protein
MMIDQSSRSHRLLLTTAWIVMLSVSMLPNALLHELAGGAPTWLNWVKIGLLGDGCSRTLVESAAPTA